MNSPSILLNINPDTPLTQDDQLHLMPFSINYEGTAQISNYFITNSLPLPIQIHPILAYFQSSFRGRYLHGTQIKIPSGYLGLLCSSSSSSNNQSSLESLPNPPKHSSMSRPTTRGRGGRARGRKLIQAVGTRQSSSRAQLKRKHPEPDGFLSDHDNNNNSDTGIKRNKKENESQHDQTGVELKENTVATNEKYNLLQVQELFIQKVDAQTITKLESIDPYSNHVPNDPQLSVANSNDDASHSVGPKIIQPIGSFNQLTIWNPDGPIDLPSDIYVRSILDWVDLAQLIHSIPSPK